MLAFLVILAIAGVGYSVTSHAATATVATVEAESMTLPVGATTYTNSTASAGQAIKLTANGSLTRSVTLSGAATSLNIKAHGNSCQGYGSLSLSVDGTIVVPATAMSTTNWTSYNGTVNLTNGAHNLTITGSNLGKSRKCSRDLYVDVTTFTGSTTTPATAGLSAFSLYVDPNSSARQQADAWRSSRPADASQMDKIAAQAQAKWFGGWNTDVAVDVDTYVRAAAAKSASTIPVLVAYNIPQRDCNGFSAGGTTVDGYLPWIKAVASGIGASQALVVLEPDAVANLDCLSSADQATRLSLLSQAVTILKANAGTYVYLDGGNPNWKTADVIGGRLSKANIAAADGFSLNVSNFYTTADNVAFGRAVSNYTGDKHFVIDTSRNGLGPTSDSQWCNPDGRALGDVPSTQTAQADPLVDASLWIKISGESDGTCNGGPAAGVWWPDYALGLAQRASY